MRGEPLDSDTVVYLDSPTHVSLSIGRARLISRAEPRWVGFSVSAKAPHDATAAGGGADPPTLFGTVWGAERASVVELASGVDAFYLGSRLAAVVCRISRSTDQ